MRSLLAIALTLTLCVPALAARETGPVDAPMGGQDAAQEVARNAAREAAPEPETVEEFEASLTYRTGTVVIGADLATLDVPEAFRYLGPEDARRLLEQGWGNPPMEPPLGMIVPADVSPMSDDGWAVVLTFEKDGYVDDAGATEIDYAALLDQMQAETRLESQARVVAGFETLDLVGWATPPRYDPETHQLHWAQELAFGDDEPHTLNYNVRLLGRRGVLVMNAVAAMPLLPTVEADMHSVMEFVSFNDGHRYADFVPGEDQVASFGVGALVAGKATATADNVLQTLLMLAALTAGAGLAAVLGRRRGQTASA